MVLQNARQSHWNSHIPVAAGGGRRNSARYDDRLVETERNSGMEISVDKPKVLTMSRREKPLWIFAEIQELEIANQFSSVTKELSFYEEDITFDKQFELGIEEKCYIFSIALCGWETLEKLKSITWKDFKYGIWEDKRRWIRQTRYEMKMF